MGNQHLENVHRFSTRHRDEIERSELVGCFYCQRIFDPSGVELAEWIDDGETLLCPFCGIDSCIGSADINPITPELLRKMHDYWFKVPE